MGRRSLRREGFSLATTTLLQRHANEGESIAEAIRDCLDYGKIPKRQRAENTYPAYECDPATVAAEFLLAKASYKAMTGREQKKGEDVLCYQIRQSFYPGEITPEEANRVSYELAMRWTKGRHAFIVTTHTDKRAHSPRISTTIPRPLTVPGSSATSGARPCSAAAL
ncbi:MAG: relaxase/mobilization nuclease domain-containing protein [Oscillospiraceae bacterium]